MNHFTYGNAGSIYSLYAFAPPYEGFPRAHRRDAELPYMIPSQPDPTHESMSAAQTSSPASVTSQEGKSRLRKACDSCSIRKVKVLLPQGNVVIFPDVASNANDITYHRPSTCLFLLHIETNHWH